MARPLVPTTLPALLLALGAGPASAAIVYTQLDHPLAGPGGTTPYAIYGERIVGGYLDAANRSHCFVYEFGSWATLDHPEAVGGTTAYGVSATRISGSYVAASGQVLGFLYDGSTWATLEHPPIGVTRGDTFARGVSDGTVVGYYIEAAVARGFIYSGGTFTDIAPPGAINTFPRDINSGRVVGNYDDPLGTHGFVFDALNWLTLDHPLGAVLGTFVTGVDGANVVGYYSGLPTGAAHGFLYDGADFLPIDFPGATDTEVNGIDGDRVVGSYVDAAGQRHGFVAAIPEPGGAAALVLLPAAACARRRRRAARA